MNRKLLHEASHHGHIETAKLLVERDAGVSLADHLGRTPLHLASGAGVEVIQLPVDHGADIMAVNNAGWTPLD